MSDELSLLLVLVALYLVECVRWLRAPGVAALGSRGAARLRGPGERLANRRGGLVWLDALGTPGAAFALGPWPLSFGPDALCIETPYAWRRLGRGQGPRRTISYGDLGDVSAQGSEVVLSAEIRLSCTSDAAAAQLAALLSALSTASPARRAALLADAVGQRFDRGAIGARIDAVHRARARPSLTAGVLALTIFGLGPALTHLYGLVAIAAPFGLGLLGVHLLHLIVVFRAHRALAPEARADRWIEFAKLLLSPPMAIRAADALSWHRLDDFDPIAVASVMAHRDDFEAWVGSIYRDLAHPTAVGDLDPTAEAIVQAERARILQAVRALLAEMQIAVDTRPAKLTDGDGFCPRCLAVYRRVDGDCGDCPGVALQRGSER